MSDQAKAVDPAVPRFVLAVSSSWHVDHGRIWEFGGKPSGDIRLYECSLCGKAGHNMRGCPSAR